MMRFRAALALGLLSLPATVHAQAAGLWRVNGAISGRTFALDCRLEQGGACVDAAPVGQTKPLASLAANVNDLQWSFKTRVVLLSVTLAFHGRVQGGQMNGTVTAAGRSGTFTATRR